MPMGGDLTSRQCLERLGIPANKHDPFKVDVIAHLTSHWGNQFHLSMEEKDIQGLAAGHVYNLWNSVYRENPLPGRHPQPSPMEQRAWLVELISGWIDERERKESQDDPSYSSSALESAEVGGKTKKRKRASESFRPPKRQVGNSAKSGSGQQKTAPNIPQQKMTSFVRHIQPSGADGSNVPRSPTIALSTAEDGSSTALDIPYASTQPYENTDDGSVNDELPSHRDLLNERPFRSDQVVVDCAVDSERHTTLSKGKKPIRDPPGPPKQDRSPSPMQMPHNTRTPDSSFESSDSEVDKGSPSRQNRTPSKSPALDRPARPQQRPYINIADIEDSHAASTSSPTASAFVDLLAAAGTPKPQPRPITAPMTPPPTTRGTRFADLPMSTACNDEELARCPSVTTSKPTQPRQERLLQLLGNIVTYIGDCESRSLATAWANTSSPREVDRHQILALAFSNLRTDVKSRIAAFLDEENGAVEKSSVKSYCRWL